MLWKCVNADDVSPTAVPSSVHLFYDNTFLTPTCHESLLHRWLTIPQVVDSRLGRCCHLAPRSNWLLWVHKINWREGSMIVFTWGTREVLFLWSRQLDWGRDRLDNPILWGLLTPREPKIMRFGIRGRASSNLASKSWRKPVPSCWNVTLISSGSSVRLPTISSVPTS